MRMKLSFLLLLTTCLCLLSGCTYTANRVYSICKEDNGVVYCYNSAGEHYKITEDATWLPSSGVGLQDLPALQLIPTEGVYNFTYQLPGLYRGTLESVAHYVNYMIEEDDATYEVTYRDWNNVEAYVYSSTYSVRIIFNIKGDVRIYAIDNSDNSIEPPYLIEK